MLIELGNSASFLSLLKVQKTSAELAVKVADKENSELLRDDVSICSNIKVNVCESFWHTFFLNLFVKNICFIVADTFFLPVFLMDFPPSGSESA